MGVHVIFSGPSTAGKTSLMVGLSKSEGFTIDKTWTTRPRRPGEDDEENVFIDSPEFEERRRDFLFTFQTHPSYEYGICHPEPLGPKEVRMRILMPFFAHRFRSMVQSPTVFCAIEPFLHDPYEIFLKRDPGVERSDMEARLNRFEADRLEAWECADVIFCNSFGIESSVQSLGSFLVNHACSRGLVDSVGPY